MKNKIIVLTISLQIFTGSFLLSISNIRLANAQTSRTSVKSIPLPTGSGARALGQGGAFIAVADDATAASWNPAGLIQLEKPEVSIVGAFLTTAQDFHSDLAGTRFQKEVLNPNLGDEDVSRWDLNFISGAYPFRFLNRNFVAALNYHQIFDFHMDLSFTPSVSIIPQIKKFEKEQFDFKSSGGIGGLSPAIAVLILPKLSFGLTVNIFDDEFFNSYGWKETITGTGKGRQPGIYGPTFFRQKTSAKDYHGVNVSMGIKWDIWEKDEKSFTFGAVFHSPYTARFDEEVNVVSSSVFQSSRIVINDDKSRVKMDWPMSIGMGLGFRYTDALSFSFDVSWTDWSEWVQERSVNGSPWENTRPIGFIDKESSEHDDIEDTYAVRFGTEYLFIREKEIIALRGGLFYEPRPSLGTPKDFDRNSIRTDYNGNPTSVWGFSLGAGLTTDRFSIDTAYQFRYIRDMEANDIGLRGASVDSVENLFLASLIIYF